jgi:hypothetical protein
MDAARTLIFLNIKTRFSFPLIYSAPQHRFTGRDTPTFALYSAPNGGSGEKKGI